MIKELTAGVDFRITKQREKILDVLISADQHLLAQDIYENLKDNGAKVGLATVYRTLDLFEDTGIVAKRKFNGDSAYYEIKDKHQSNHHHLICKNCGKVIEVEELLSDNLEDKLKEEEGFTVQDLCLQMYGYCEDCRDKN
ncbi:MAG: Fur family transcriptional regulator [Bacillota bacterium]